MEFSKKIQALRSKAQETQAANKIMDMLTDLKLKNDASTSYRWIWELIQNAKDVVNSSGKVDIVINFEQSKRSIDFMHNGKLFSTKNIVFLIEQVSTKDRTVKEDRVNRATGKFGTGFLTTHLLSEQVNVSGYLQDLSEPPCSFNVSLDRSGKTKESIIEAIQESCLQLDQNTKMCIGKIDETDFNTCFTYNLDETGMATAKTGLNNLIISAPYVFAFVPEINSITVISNEYKQIISRGEIVERLENGYVLEVIVQTMQKGTNFSKNKCIYIFEKNDLSLAVEVENRGNEKQIVKYREELPRLFCDFPLLGTNDFSFPVVINCPLFNPTEPRNGIHLTNKEHEKISENKQRLKDAAQLYCSLIEYFSKSGYKGIHNIVKISEQPEKDWLSKDWYEENIIESIKSFIKKIPLIYTHSGEKKPLFDEFGDTSLFISKDLNKIVREKVWELSSKFIPNMIPKEEEIEFWYDSLWDECRNYSLVDLINKVEEFKSVEEFSGKITHDVYDWLNQLISLVYSKEENILISMEINPTIFPNQEGNLCDIETIFLDCNIDEIYKEIATSINFNVKSKLLDKRIKSDFSTKIRKYTIEDIFLEIENNLQNPYRNIEEFYKSIICLRSHHNQKQEQFLKLINDLYSNCQWTELVVSRSSDKLLGVSLEFWMDKICKDISLNQCIETFTNNFSFSNSQEAVNWLSRFIDFIKKYKNEFLLDRFSILPNQYGIFKKSTELSLDSGELEEILKDASKYSGYDVREDMLLKDIDLHLPKNRTVYLEDLSEKITKFVKENKNNIGHNNDLVKEVFNKFYLWLRENTEYQKVNEYFKELLSNLHWFYNDNDIAENISKVEKYNDILQKYSVSGIQELENILENSALQSVASTKVEISAELLAQWGISNEDDLNRALANNIINAEFIHDSKRSIAMFNYVKEILERSKNNILTYLSKREEYDVSDPIEISDTIFVIRKNNVDIYLITRPSDYNQIILYYQSEIDMLDYEKDCELWVEDGLSQPQKITFGTILKLTGVNKIPLRSIKYS
ncbi:sacsin N-terminal ATP-binding-like domain-containing protein [Lysinibacillus sp. PWR01]|uniref:sacsin N-terminal ATP-binding-like domain-containing protein n=1 Tax=Lysinibacillus sp. PWR01 TaxID=3342384 RepID=UPI00372D293B